MQEGINIVESRVTDRVRVWLMWKGRKIYIGSAGNREEAEYLVKSFKETVYK